MSGGLRGGCACGTVRYRLGGAPFDAGWCHCRICQRVSGAPALAYATVAIGDFVVEAGGPSLATYRSTHFGARQHCAACGTALTMAVTHQPDTIDFTLASLDDPDAVVPGYHIFCEQAPGWAAIDDGLPRHDRFRPDTRGLDGVDPPE